MLICIKVTQFTVQRSDMQLPPTRVAEGSGFVRPEALVHQVSCHYTMQGAQRERCAKGTSQSGYIQVPHVKRHYFLPSHSSCWVWGKHVEPVRAVAFISFSHLWPDLKAAEHVGSSFSPRDSRAASCIRFPFRWTRSRI